MIYGLEFDSKYYGNRYDVGLTFGLLETWVDDFEFDLGIGSSQKAGNREMAMSPNLNGSISFLAYLRQDLYVNIVNTYKSEYYFSDSHDFMSDSYSVTNFSVSKVVDDFKISFWAKNIFDERYAVRGFYFGLIPPNYEDKLWISYGDPKQVGISIRYSFNDSF